MNLHRDHLGLCTAEELQATDDPLAPARGITAATCIGAALWIAFIGIGGWALGWWG